MKNSETSKTPWFQIIVDYNHYKGGVYNLQTATVKTIDGRTLKTFTSKKRRAKEYANRFIKKLNQKIKK